MRKPMSLAHKVIIPGRKIDLKHTDVRETFRRARREQEEQAKKITPIIQQRKRA